MVREAITDMGDEFDTHELIRFLAHRNQRAYVDALQNVNGSTPFQTLHSMIGREIESMKDEYHLAGKASASPDLFGNQGNCILWRRSEAYARGPNPLSGLAPASQLCPSFHSESKPAFLREPLNSNVRRFDGDS